MLVKFSLVEVKKFGAKCVKVSFFFVILQGQTVKDYLKVMRRILSLLLLCVVLSGCSSRLKKENEALRKEIDERREALHDKQQGELLDARRQLALTDSLLTVVQREHDELHAWVMSHGSDLNGSSPEVLRLNRLRSRRDSLQMEFESLAHKVKFYLRKTGGK